MTERDFEILRFLSRVKFASTKQIAQAIFGGEITHSQLTITTRRCTALVQLEMIERQHIIQGYGGLCWLTGDGLRLLGYPSGNYRHRPRLGSIPHDFLVTELMLKLGTRPDLEIITEREIQRGEEQWRYSAKRPDGKTRSCYPDLVTISPTGDAWGHEVEFTPKSTRRLELLMLAYAASPQFKGARYYAHPSILENVRKVAQDVNQKTEARGQGRPIAVTVWPTPEEVE